LISLVIGTGDCGARQSTGSEIHGNLGRGSVSEPNRGRVRSSWLPKQGALIVKSDGLTILLQFHCLKVFKPLSPFRFSQSGPLLGSQELLTLRGLLDDSSHFHEFSYSALLLLRKHNRPCSDHQTDSNGPSSQRAARVKIRTSSHMLIFFACSNTCLGGLKTLRLELATFRASPPIAETESPLSIYL